MGIDLKSLGTDDPIKRVVEKNEGGAVYSPFDPPQEPLKKESVSYENMSPLLRSFMDDHAEIRNHLQKFEQALQDLNKNGFTKQIQIDIRDFFECFDQKIIPHSRREEKLLFLDLHERLIKMGEHSPGGEPIQTGVTVLEEEHVNIIQMGAIVFNFFGLSSRLKDQTSKLQVLNLAIEKSTQLIETLRLHILREDTILFPLAQKHICSHLV